MPKAKQSDGVVLTTHMTRDREFAYLAACRYFECDAEAFRSAVFGESRGVHVVELREQMAVYLTMLEYNQPEVAAMMMRPSHSSVTSMLQRVADSPIKSASARLIFDQPCRHCGKKPSEVPNG